MGLAEHEQEVGQFRVGECVALLEQQVAQLAAGREHMAQPADIVLAVREGPPRRAWWWRHPAGEEVAAPLAQFAQHVWQ